VAEVALTLLLLVGAGLMLRSFHQLQRVSPGFTHERVLVFRVGLPRRKYPGSQQTDPGRFIGTCSIRLQSLPGVQMASVTSRVPLEGGGWDTSFLIEGQPRTAAHERPPTEVQTVGPDYFRTVGIPLVRGPDVHGAGQFEHIRGYWPRKLMGRWSQHHHCERGICPSPLAR